MSDAVTAEGDDGPQSLSSTSITTTTTTTLASSLSKDNPPLEHQNNSLVETQAENNDDDELRKLLFSDDDVANLPLSPPTAMETNFARYFATDFMKPGHDQYVYRHANGLCVIGIAPTHVALQAEGGVTSVDFNVGKSDRSEFKVSGKRKKNAQHFQTNSILCNVSCGDATYTIRCCVKGSLLEVNNRLIQNPGLLNMSADREGYIAIVMPRPADWLKNKESLVTFDEYMKLRKLS